LVDRSDDAEYYVAVFTPRLIAQACRGRGYEGLKLRAPRDAGVLHTALDPEAFDFIRRTMDTLMRDSLDPDLLNREGGYGVESDFRYEHGDPDALNAGLRHLLLLCWRSQTVGPKPGGAVSLHPAVRKALELLSEGESDEDLGQLARRCAVSEAYLSRVFRRQIGVPLSRYRNSVRLARFWEAYRHPEQKTVTEAMFEAGFGSYAQFYRVFAQAYGEGPRACLRRNDAVES
jgi:methylphosphotriester-DNA--protein-cysteine methyltransferase